MGSGVQIWRDALRQQFAFHFRETHRLLEMARLLPADLIDVRDRYSHEGIRPTIEHILGANGYWRGVLSEIQVEDRSVPASTGWEELIAWNDQEHVKWEELLGCVDDEMLGREVEMTLTFGAYRFTPGQAMQHVILHGQIHHGEIARLLTAAGLAPGDVDYFDYIARPA